METLIGTNTHITEEGNQTKCGKIMSPAMRVEKFSALVTYYIDTQYPGLCKKCKLKYYSEDLKTDPPQDPYYLHSATMRM